MTQRYNNSDSIQNQIYYVLSKLNELIKLKNYTLAFDQVHALERFIDRLIEFETSSI